MVAGSVGPMVVHSADQKDSASVVQTVAPMAEPKVASSVDHLVGHSVVKSVDHWAV